VPSVTGWLSLNCRGLWRLHPLGDASGGGAGESITNEQILRFIDRNYAHDAHGAWFFQNGPQRVYARLDAAPYVIRFDPGTGMLSTHNRLDVTRVDEWIADDAGNLYAGTDLGPGRVDDRDLPALADLLVDSNGRTLLELLEDTADVCRPAPSIPLLRVQSASDTTKVSSIAQGAVLIRCPAIDIPAHMGFIANPTAGYV